MARLRQGPRFTEHHGAENMAKAVMQNMEVSFFAGKKLEETWSCFMFKILDANGSLHASVLSCSSQACKLKPKTTRREEIWHFAASCNQSMLLILVLQTSTIQKRQRNIWSLLLCKVVPLGQLDNEHRCRTLADLQSHTCCYGQQCHGLHQIASLLTK